MQGEEGDECERGPEPADLDEEGVEDVALEREVGWCGVGGVGLRDCAVGRGARFWLEDGK